MNLNKAIIIGNLTQNPETRTTPNGQTVANFTIATNRVWTNQQGQKQEQAEFHNIVAWGKLAEIVTQILHKGSKAYVEGRLQTRSWEGQDGAKRQRTEIVAENFIALNAKGETSGPSGPAAPDLGSDVSEFPIEEPPASKKPTKEVKSAPVKKETPKEPVTEDSDEEINLDEIPF